MAMLKEAKALEGAGLAKRANRIRMLWSAIKANPTFNVAGRLDDCEENQSLLAHISNGGPVPPIEVWINSDGVPEIVEGHRRHYWHGKAMENGAPVDEWMDVDIFKGNDADRVARIVNSNSGMQLKPIQLCDVYMRLSRMGHSTAQIAAKVGRSSVHVADMLKLAAAPAEVQMMVKSGEVSATQAIKAVKVRGENAGDTLKAPKLPRMPRVEKIDTIEELSAMITRAEQGGAPMTGYCELGKRLAALLWKADDATS